MAEPHCVALPYRPDTVAWFGPWAGEAWAVWLDSGYPGSRRGRYDIFAARPYATVVTRGSLTEIHRHGRSRYSETDPFAVLRELLDERTDAPVAVPFGGGAIGYFSYDLGRRLEQLPVRAEDAEQIPEMMVGLYDWAVVVDHLEQRSWLVSAGRDAATEALWPELLHRCTNRSAAVPPAFRVVGEARANFDYARYAEAFRRVQHYIWEGDCYQVNLAQRFAAAAEGDAYAAYLRLRECNAAPFCAFLNLPEVQVLSSSPERFLRVRGAQVQAKPIKGTRRRGLTPAEDFALIDALQSSLKDRAENVMIVDLLRNDLGKSCVPGSISVPELCEVESFATVHHLVSTIEGRLAPDRHALDLLRGCFPGGSITGAPKIRAMEIIEELEPHRRGVYCGAVGWVGFNGDMDTNIAIRTLVYSHGTLRLWAGGGLVADSHLDSEYQECYTKAGAILKLLQDFRRG